MLHSTSYNLYTSVLNEINLIMQIKKILLFISMVHQSPVYSRELDQMTCINFH